MKGILLIASFMVLWFTPKSVRKHNQPYFQMKLDKKECFKREPDCALAADVYSVHRTTLELVRMSPPWTEFILASARPTPDVQHYFLV